MFALGRSPRTSSTPHLDMIDAIINGDFKGALRYLTKSRTRALIIRIAILQDYSVWGYRCPMPFSVSSVVTDTIFVMYPLA